MCTFIPTVRSVQQRFGDFAFYRIHERRRVVLRLAL